MHVLDLQPGAREAFFALQGACFGHQLRDPQRGGVWDQVRSDERVEEGEGDEDWGRDGPPPASEHACEPHRDQEGERDEQEGPGEVYEALDEPADVTLMRDGVAPLPPERDEPEWDVC